MADGCTPPIEFGKLRILHHTIGTYSSFQWATTSSSEKDNSIIAHLQKIMAIMAITVQRKVENALTYVSKKIIVFEYVI